MKINNPFQINDWEFKKFFKVVLTIQLAFWGAIGLDVIGLQIPILRQLIGFIYLTFIPGITILRVLKLHKLSNIETLLYTIGLSIATLMFTGLFMNTVYPPFGISGPISTTPLIITISVVVSILCALSYIRDKDFSDSSFIDVGIALSPPALFLCLVPFLSIFGAYLVNFNHNSVLLMFLIIILAIIVILIGFDKIFQVNLYPLVVFIIAVSLVYHNSLISMYLWGSDIHREYLYSNLVETNSIWDPSIANLLNSMLSIVILAPFYSILLNLDIVWLFKIIYPLIFSLISLGLYHIYQKQTDDNTAFLSCVFFLSFWIFYTEMLQLARQQIAELFLVLLILLMIDKNMNGAVRSILSIVFCISLAVSHYGLSDIYMLCLISAWFILVLGDNPEIQKRMNNFYSKFYKYTDQKLSANSKSLKTEDRTIRLSLVLLFITFAFTWYMHVSGSSAFDTLVFVGDRISGHIFIDFLNSDLSEGLGTILYKPASLLHSTTKYLHLLSQFFIFIGIITLLLKRNATKFVREYAVFSLITLMLCLASIAVPYFSSALNTSRTYQISLIFLAPFCVIGGITTFRITSLAVKASWNDLCVRSSLKVLSVFFATYLLFNSGWVYEVAKDDPASISLSPYTDRSCYNEREASGGKWLSDCTDSDSRVCGDLTACTLLRDWFHKENMDPQINIGILENAYIYLRSWNIDKQELLFIEAKNGLKSPEYFSFKEIPKLVTLITANNKVYDNGGSQIFEPSDIPD